MLVFPPVALKPEVRDHLKNTFKNEELVSEVGEEVADQEFEALLSSLSHPPSFTCVRVNTHLAPRHQVQHTLQQELSGQKPCGHHDEDASLVPLPHPQLPDVLLLPIIGPRRVCVLNSEVVVGSQCGSAVLRGAHVFAPGILSASKILQVGDAVSVFSDVENKCTRGAKSFQGQKVFLGNGVCEMSRSDVFCSKGPTRGVAVRMTDRVYITPCFDGVLPRLVFLQNLPSILVSHVLGPRPGECVLDMCAAPGGKTTHIATLMGNKGVVVALDKISSKVKKLHENAALQQMDCIKAFCYNSIQAMANPDHTQPVSHQAQASVCVGASGPPFPEGSFDRVLLDAPCSSLGQRPNMAINSSLKEICSYQPLQRKLLNTAVHLLKRGGVLVYSTCTVTLAENEEQVAWALRTFPCLKLQPQEPHLGQHGMLGAGLSQDQRRLLQRFHPRMREGGPLDGHAPTSCLDDADSDGHAPTPSLDDVDSDTIGFFIAKFIKS